MSKKLFGCVLTVAVLSCSSLVAQCCNNQPVFHYDHPPMITQSFDAPIAWNSNYIVYDSMEFEPAFVETSWSAPSYIEMPMVVESSWIVEPVSYEIPVYYTPFAENCCCETALIYNESNSLIVENADSTPAVSTPADSTPADSTPAVSEAVVFAAPVDNVVQGEVHTSTLAQTETSAALAPEEEVTEVNVNQDEATESEDANIVEGDDDDSNEAVDSDEVNDDDSDGDDEDEIDG